MGRKALELLAKLDGVVGASIAGVGRSVVQRVATPIKVGVTDLTDRDGIQALTEIVPTPVKTTSLGILAQAGFRRIEATSIVGKGMPQFADWSEVHKFIQTNPALSPLPFSYLVLNKKGAEMAVAAGGVKEVGFVISPSEMFTLKNMGAKSLDEMYDRAKSISDVAKEAGIKRRVFVSTCFHDPYTDKPIEAAKAAEFLQMAAAIGDEVVISDTTGHATKDAIGKLFELSKLDPALLATHFHDTRGTALENALFAITELGILTTDSSTSSIGKGCPFAPGASGNLDTFALVIALERMGYDTGVNIRKVFEVAEYLFTNIPNLTASSSYQILREADPAAREEFFNILQPKFRVKEEEKTAPKPTAQPLEISQITAEVKQQTAAHH